VVKRQLPKLKLRVRFPLSAPAYALKATVYGHFQGFFKYKVYKKSPKSINQLRTNDKSAVPPKFGINTPHFASVMYTADIPSEPTWICPVRSAAPRPLRYCFCKDSQPASSLCDTKQYLLFLFIAFGMLFDKLYHNFEEKAT
jgi:hypothetical protein